MSGKAIAARLVATQLLHAVLFDGRLLSEAIASPKSALARLSPPERARAQSLATGVLRHLGRLDAVLDRFLEKSPPPKVRNALRLAAFECLVEGNAAHGVVNAAVEIVRGSPKSGHLAGLTNAVARKVALEGQAIWVEQVAQPLPSWLAKPIVKNFGKEARLAIEAAHEAGAPVDISVKNPANLEMGADLLNATILPTGSLRLAGRPQISALDGFATGDWWVQDAAAALPVRLLADVGGKTVLDLCAAPGGKTMQLAALGAQVTALDISAPRMERLNENLSRTALSANVVVADVLERAFEGRFDAVLLDAPCSATGTIRRHPDLPFVKAGSDMSALFQMQADMIDAALEHLKPEGLMVYCTCSLLVREGESQVIRALERHKGLSVIDPPAAIAGMNPNWRTAEGGWRLRPDFWPELGGMDGFYMVLMQNAPG